MEPEEQKLNSPERFQQMLLELEGYLQGVAMDSALDDREAQVLRHWLIVHSRLLANPPFDALKSELETILEDGHLDREEWEDITWLCRSLTQQDGPGRQRISEDMRRLQGILRGVLSDGQVTEEEVLGLKNWLEEHLHMEGYWPYDEIVRLVREVLSDHQLDAAEREMLHAYFNDFTLISAESELKGSTSRVPSMLSGLLATDPKVRIPKHRFAFTGLSSRGSRSKLVDAIQSRGGIYQRDVDDQLDALIVGGGMADSWAFSCFGRKVEAAVKLRQTGIPLQIISEQDFWNACEK